MPVVGEFHGKFWRARANTPPPPVLSRGGYPVWQASVIAMMVFWPPMDVLKPYWRQLRWYLSLAKRLWRWRAPANQDQLEMWIARLEEFDAEQEAVVERAVTLLRGPHWREARARVRGCATTLGFHDPKAWIAYSRALRANTGQAQNIYRHLKVVHEFTEAHPDMPNPEAHLLAELAYHGLASQGRAGLTS